MAVLGRKTLSEAERYTRDADQAQLATAAVAKLEGRNGNRSAQTGRMGLGKWRKPTDGQRDNCCPSRPGRNGSRP